MRTDAYDALGDPVEQRSLNHSLLSHHIRKATDAGNLFLITQEIILRYTHDAKLPDPQEQANNLILWIGDKQSSYEIPAFPTVESIAAAVGTAIPTGNHNANLKEPALRWLLEQVAPAKLYDNDVPGPPKNKSFRLTMEGWKRYHELKLQVVTGHRAFMATQFGDTTLDKVVAECFKPAVEKAGFELRQLDEEQPSGNIDNQIRAAIRTARFIVADLTHDNNGAYFEAGFAEGIGIPVIYTCEQKKFSSKKTHFDTNHMLTVPWSNDQLEDAGRRLTATIRATLPDEAKFDVSP